MNEITFKYYNIDYNIKYSLNEKLKDIFNRFGEKIKCPLYYITFFFNKNKLNNNITIKDIPNFENSQKIIKAVEICHNCKSKIEVYIKNDNYFIYECYCQKTDICIFCHKVIDINNRVECNFCKKYICSLCKNNHYLTHDDEILLKYSIKQYSSKLRIFGQKFSEINKKNCIVIYEGKEYKLKPTLNLKILKLKNTNYFEIRLKGINNINISGMFDNCEKLVSISVLSNSQFDTIDITDMSYLFNNCINLLYLPDISNWNTNKVTNMEQMFNNCRSLLNLPDISKWITSNVFNMNNMFTNCLKIKVFPDISKWNTSKVKYMNGLFQGCINCNILPDISKWNISNVTSIESIFAHCESIEKFPDISKWDTKNIINIKNLFDNCKKATILPDISKWDISHPNSLNSLFRGCESLKELPDISKWKTDNITNMSNIFSGCKSLLLLPDISKWKTSKVVTIDYMFYNCKSLSYLPDISKWLTNSLKVMDYAFYGCQSFVLFPNISKWNLVERKYKIISHCISLSYFPEYCLGIKKSDECFSLMNTKFNTFNI